jgi:hypothetical protein
VLRFFKDDSAQGMVEYLLVVGLVVAMIMSLAAALAHFLQAG